MHDTADALRRLITATRPPATRHGFPSATRSRVVSYVIDRLEDGATLGAIAGELHLPRGTLQKWVARGRDERLVPVVIADDPLPTMGSVITITSPRGFRMTVHDVEVAVRLMARLG